MKVDIDNRSGFCFGVVKAITTAEEALRSGEPIVSLGDIVHNPIEVHRLGELGLQSVSREQLGNMIGGRMLIRAHGEPPSTYTTARLRGISVVDATCPVVAKLQKLVRQAYEETIDSGGQIVILGKKGHAEVEGLLGQVDGDAIVIERMEDLDNLDFEKHIYILSQTTQSPALFNEIVCEIEKLAQGGMTVRNTICREVAGREEHIAEFASSHDVVIFVSGRKSSNGRALFGVCAETNPRSYMVEHEGEVRREWLAGIESVGVCGATSTPRWLMEKVRERLLYFDEETKK